MGDRDASVTAGVSETKSQASVLKTEVYGALLSLFGLALLLALVTFHPDDTGVSVISGSRTHNLLGPVGAHMAQLFLWGLGLGAFLLDALLGYIGIRALFRRPVCISLGSVAWSLLSLVMFLVFVHVISPQDMRPFGARPAGVLGLLLGEVAKALFSETGAGIVSGSVLAIGIAALSGRSLGAGLRAFWRVFWKGSYFVGHGVYCGFAKVFSRMVPKREKTESENSAEQVEDKTKVGFRFAATSPVEMEPFWVKAQSSEVASPHEATRKVVQCAQPTSESVDLLPEEEKPSGPRIVLTRRKREPIQDDLPLDQSGKSYARPPLSLLDLVEGRSSPIDQDLLRRNAETLERKLLDYKVEGRVVQIHPGPVVTMYEFLPAPGVKISQIANLEDDLTMALEAMSIRIVAPIPGKGVVGIEVPNLVRETVYLREILASEAFAKSKSKLTLALGKDIFGNPVVTDLSRMPHLLIAGATGSGKSVAINAFLLSILYNATPEEVRIILVDPKVVELQVYDGVPHLLLPVVYDPKHASAALRWAVEEMERRYDLLARFGTRNIQSYNQRIERLASGEEGEEIDEREPGELQKLPYIVIILDEFADLMMVAAKDVETAVARLAQKARAAGIHLIMATQRPSKEVITGLIKANFTCRISFRVSSKVDSRIILDQNGAEALLGYGDMLFLRPGTSVLTRIHGPYVSEEEVQRVVTFLKAQGEPQYNLDILKVPAESEETEDPRDLDPLLDEAINIILEERRASISYLQRRLKVGYNRAARIMEQIERKGIVGPPDSRGERQVLV